MRSAVALILGLLLASTAAAETPRYRAVACQGASSSVPPGRSLRHSARPDTVPRGIVNSPALKSALPKTRPGR